MKDPAPVTVGLIGCGNISSRYLENSRRFPNLQILACADLDLQRAQDRAAEFGVPRACSVDELLADPAVEIVLNLTVPAAHAEISLRALGVRKHVYSEKPLAVDRASGQRILRSAAQHRLLVGCAPDTFLGDGLQTSRHLIDGEAIGRPVAATAFVMSHGHESWHPNPDFFFQPGGGPLFDMAPYYLTALTVLLGPVRRVTGFSRISFAERTITSQPRYGETISVTTPTHVTGILDFASGAIGTMIASFDVWSHGLPPIEIYGSEGTLQIPDPNCFGGPVRLRRAGWAASQDVTSTSPYTEDCRGLGLSDLADAVRRGGSYRASGELAYHVLDIMEALYESAETGRHVDITSSCRRPEPLPLELRPPIDAARR